MFGCIQQERKDVSILIVESYPKQWRVFGGCLWGLYTLEWHLGTQCLTTWLFGPFPQTWFRSCRGQCCESITSRLFQPELFRPFQKLLATPSWSSSLVTGSLLWFLSHILDGTTLCLQELVLKFHFYWPFLAISVGPYKSFFSFFLIVNPWEDDRICRYMPLKRLWCYEAEQVRFESLALYF